MAYLLRLVDSVAILAIFLYYFGFFLMINNNDNFYYMKLDNGRTKDSFKE